MNKYPHQLSGGMQQRVAIAQALLMQPPVLLMDEAFSALDPSTRSSLQEQLHAIWLESRPTVVFVTHNTQEALLLGTRLILLGRHARRNAAGKAMCCSTWRFPHRASALRRATQSPEFQRAARARESSWRTDPRRCARSEELIANRVTAEGNLR